MIRNYTVLYSTFRKRYAEQYMASKQYPNMVLWLMGNGEWQVRAYTHGAAVSALLHQYDESCVVNDCYDPCEKKRYQKG